MSRKIKKQKQKESERLNIIPLGGLGEIGKNMMAIEYGEDIIIIDAGMMFPEDEMLGVDFIIPDFRYLEKRAKNIRGIIITHGHEDHIGALPYVLRKIQAPIYGTKLTLGLIQNKLSELEPAISVELNCVKPRTSIQLGVFKVEFFRVSHSIPDGVGLGIHTPFGVIIHTGDFKIDQTPINGESTDFHKIAEICKDGALALLSDSTNVEKEGYTISEQEVGEIFKQVFRGASGRIIVTTFASNVYRIQQAIDASAIYNRKVCVIGRSMENVTAMAAELGYLTIPTKTLITVDELKHVPLKRTVIITTGSQGEPMSALTRMSMHTHRHIKISNGDTVIISARAIPGNEVSISRTINNLFKLGAEVVYENVSEVHVSGHASQEELKLMFTMVKPKYFIPIHGEYRHLVHHAKLAQKMGVPAKNIFIMENGAKLEITNEKAMMAEKVEAGQILIDGKGVGDIGTVVLRDRQQLAQDGMLIVVVTVDRQSARLLAGPEIISRGFIYVREADELMNEAKTRVRKLFEELVQEGTTNWPAIKSGIRNTLGKYLFDMTERRPMILPVIVEL
ncbi:ribonuclease J [bacterium]|nr:ribonuclease J [bacterium]MBU1752517.1 ribonuclease J [bacterium]